MKRLVKILVAGLVVGGLEVGAIALLAFRANAGQFQDLAFGFLIATVLLWLLVLFSGRRIQMMGFLSTNSTAQSAFAAQVAYEESKLLRKVPPMRGRLLGSLSVLVAAVVVLIAFLVSATLG